MKAIITAIVFITAIYQLYAQNLYTQSNAANIENEANTTTGWSGPAAITSSATNPQNGTYSLLITSNSGGNRYGIYSFTAVSGTTYNISIWARRGSNNSNSVFANWTGFSNFTSQSIASQQWALYTFTVTAASTSPSIRVYASDGGPAGRTVYVDAITITAQTGDTQAPTAPANLLASNITESSLTLNWTASTDNVGVTGYRIFQNNQQIDQTGNNNTSYNITNLTAASTYSYFVRAVDAAGNESSNSNTQTITTLNAGGGSTAYTTENANLPTVNWQSQNLYVAGVMGIFTQPNSSFRLSVNGDIRTKDLIVQPGWSDYVFEPGYQLPTLQEVEEFIIANGRLKDIPSAAEIEKHGARLGETNALLLLKVEELTLYLIEMNKRLQNLQKEIEFSY